MGITTWATTHLFLFIFTLLYTVSNAGCPFAAMMNNYNFSGDWSFNTTEDGTDAYVMHICHFENHEMYFSLAKNDTPHHIIGFGAGNWSQTNMMIGGQMYSINNASSTPHGFGIGMNMEALQWWFQSPNHSTRLDEGNKSEAFDSKLCVIPYGIDVRKEYFHTFWDKKRKFHRQQRIQKRMRDRKKRNKEKKNKKKPIYVQYYEEFLDFFGFGDVEVENATLNETINAKFVYDIEPNFPSIYGKTWTNEDGLSATIEDAENGCFGGERLSNLSIAHFGVGVNSYIENEDGIRNGQFFVMIDKDEVIGSSITFKKDENGQIVENEIKGFTLSKSDTFIPCPKSAKCQAIDGQKCEL